MKEGKEKLGLLVLCSSSTEEVRFVCDQTAASTIPFLRRSKEEFTPSDQEDIVYCYSKLDLKVAVKCSLLKLPKP